MHRLKSVFFLILCFFPLLITANISANESRPERLRAQNTNISIYKSYNDVKQTQNTNIPIYKSFDNIFPDAEANSITSFIQDEDGMIWIGTNKGIYNYDGYNSYPHFSTGDKSNTRIYCMTALNSDYLLLGGDKGLLIYDIKSNSYQDIEQVINIVINNNKVNNNNSGKAVDKYVDNPVKNRITVDNSKLPSDIRSIYKDNNDIWIGAIAGLYKLNLSTGEITSFKASEHKGLTHDAIYSIIAGCKGRIYFGTYNGLCFYDKKYKSFTELKIPGAGERNNIFVNSLLYDKDKECIWIGTEGELYKYMYNDNTFTSFSELSKNSIKTLAHNRSKDVLIGTDNGLYILEKNGFRHIVHDSRNINSLSNNIVWSIYSDKDQNMWIGTDYGLSLDISDTQADFYPVFEITGTGDGNHFYSMHKDSSGKYWMGGTNGLIKSSTPDNSSKAIWYKMGDSKNNLSHNRVRHIFEDSKKNLWIATDGSINRYNDKTESFIRYDIVDSTGTRNSNWAYNILEDNSGRLWIATCLGGIFVVDRDKLPANGGRYVADYNFCKENGLSGVFINQIVADKNNDIWVLLYNNGINKINSSTFEVIKIDIDVVHVNSNPNYIIADKEGKIWSAYRGGIMYIDPAENIPHYIDFSFSDNESPTANVNTEVLSMTEVENEIWVSTSDGVWIVNKDTYKTDRIGNSGKTYISIVYNNEKLYMGYANGVAITTPDRFRKKHSKHTLSLTALYVNNELELSRGGKGIRYIEEPVFTSKENHIVFEFSDLPYQCETKSKFLYKLEGRENIWNVLPAGSNRITFNSLKYGKYTLLVKGDNALDEEAMKINFRILPPAYLTPWAKSIYALITIALIIWIINFFRVRTRLRNERAEKARVIEQTRQKMDFYANISHEFTSPLSNIIAPVSKMMLSAKSNSIKSELESVQLNAMKINSMIHRIIEFDRIDTNYNTSLILSAVDIVELTGSIFAYTRERNDNKKLQIWNMSSDNDSTILNADVLKIESIISNILSNASRYTPEGGRITLSVTTTDSMCIIEVKDNGIGIPEKDLPYVTQRFFQSSNNTEKKEGTGVGLYLAKMYTEMHNGTLTISSKEGEGTSVIVSLPLISIEENNSGEKNPEDMMLHAMQIMAQHDLNKKKEKLDSILPEVEKTDAVSVDELFLANVTSAIEDRIDDFDLNVTSLCDQLNISNKQLYRKVKQLTGASPVEYIKIIRMKKAAMLLRQNKFTVSEVVYMVGFSNASYFSKCFQNEFGQTPKSYMESILS